MLDPALIPAAARRPDFMAAVTHELSHAYTVVFAVVVAIVALAYIPAMMLPHRRPEDTADDKPAAAALAH